MHQPIFARINVTCDFEPLLDDAVACAEALTVQLNEIEEGAFVLNFTEKGVSLFSPLYPSKAAICVDFCQGKVAHRRIYGGGKGQMIAKAVGISSKLKPSIFDATAGLGKDAFVLASLGCEVTLMERSPVAFYLLKDGLRRGREYAVEADPELHQIFERMHLIAGDSIQYLSLVEACAADVVYLDPMFPERQKKAAVKKDMQAFHGVVGHDLDNEQLFGSAQHKAKYRIVVKRPRLAPSISSVKPNYSLQGKSSRYDIYTYKSMTLLSDDG